MKVLARKFCGAIGLCLLVVVGCGQTAPTIPIYVPLRFGVDRFVEFPVKIERYRNYYLDLLVYFENNEGGVRDVVGIWRGALSGNIRISDQAARSIG